MINKDLKRRLNGTYRQRDNSIGETILLIMSIIFLGAYIGFNFYMGFM